jgi:hypothetical protein
VAVPHRGGSGAVGGQTSWSGLRDYPADLIAGATWSEMKIILGQCCRIFKVFSPKKCRTIVGLDSKCCSFYDKNDHSIGFFRKTPFFGTKW